MYFETQPKNTETCVLHALNNALQKKVVNEKDYKEIVEKIATTKSGNNVEKKKELLAKLADFHSTHLEKGYTQDHWSFTVAQTWLDDNKIKWIMNPKKIHTDVGHYLLHILVHERSHHAVAIVDGWYLDSLKEGPRKLTNDFLATLTILRVWCIISDEWKA